VEPTPVGQVLEPVGQVLEPVGQVLEPVGQVVDDARDELPRVDGLPVLPGVG